MYSFPFKTILPPSYSIPSLWTPSLAPGHPSKFSSHLGLDISKDQEWSPKSHAKNWPPTATSAGSSHLPIPPKSPTISILGRQVSLVVWHLPPPGICQQGNTAVSNITGLCCCYFVAGDLWPQAIQLLSWWECGPWPPFLVCCVRLGIF